VGSLWVTGDSMILTYSALGSVIFRVEAAIALRQRLNETVDELEALRKEHAALEVEFETQNKELTIAKSDRKHESPESQRN
jgi:hypothetical protein